MTPYDTTRHDTTPYDTTQHRTTRHCTTPHHTTPHHTTPHHTTPHHTTPHHTTPHIKYPLNLIELCFINPSIFCAYFTNLYFFCRINDIVRYDPLDDLHAKYENVEEHIESETEELELPTKDQKAGDKAYPEVAKESYYDVSCNLKGLFKKPVCLYVSYTSHAIDF